MSSQKCKKCGKFVSENSAFRDGNDNYCGDCAIKVVVATHLMTEEEAERILTRQQVGNGYAW